MIERWTPKIKKALTNEWMELRMWTDKEGDYVLYKDYTDLESRLAAAEEKNKELETYIKERTHGCKKFVTCDECKDKCEV